jgi:hypothetical protein
LELGSFGNVRDQVGFCGIWCGSCVAGNGAVLELARRLGELVEKNNLEKWAPKDFDFKEFKKGLASIGGMKSCPGCRKRDGNPACKVRICALARQTDDCSQCEKLAECENFEALQKGHPMIKKELMETRGIERDLLVKKWTEELKTKWPHCILFMSER